MINVPDQRFERICIEEYKALRSESLRCGGIISNTIWVGVTQYAITCISVLALNIKIYTFPLLIVLLILESISATVMFLSEVFKYSRIGRYLRCKIEKSFIIYDFRELIFREPMGWEHWIQDKRSRTFYAVSLIILQSPVIVFLFTLSVSNEIGLFDALFVSKNYIFNISILMFIILLLIIDLSAVIIISIRIIQENRHVNGNIHVYP